MKNLRFYNINVIPRMNYHSTTITYSLDAAQTSEKPIQRTPSFHSFIFPSTHYSPPSRFFCRRAFHIFLYPEFALLVHHEPSFHLLFASGDPNCETFMGGRGTAESAIPNTLCVQCLNSPQKCSARNFSRCRNFGR